MNQQMENDVPVTQADLGPGCNSGASSPSTRNVYLVISMAFGVESLSYRALIEKVAASVPPADLTAVLHPESILPHARCYAAECDTVVNLETLSGIGGAEEICFEDGQSDVRRFEFHAGTWGDINFERKKQFVWGHPTKECSRDHRCRADRFNDPADVPFRSIRQESDGAWEKLSHYTAKPPYYGVNLAAVRAGAIVLAPGRWSPFALRMFLSVVKRHDLKMLDWRREAFCDRWLFAEIECGQIVL
jgi:hypothetical protein